MRKFIPDKLFNSKSSEKSFGFRKVTNLTVLILSMGLLFAACDDDPAGPDEDPGDDPDPVEVEASFTMEPENPITGDEVTLDASNSSVTNNGDLSYSWALTPPDGSSAELENTDQVNTSFTPDEAGDYDIELTVSANGETDETSAVAEVTAEEEISSDITEDRTFSSDVTYIVTRSIDVEAELTIEPGTVIKFENEAELQLPSTSGALIADGTEDEPILFTGTEQQPGWWNGLYIRESDNINNQLNWVTVEYGGGEEFFRSGSGNVIIGRRGDGASIDITNSTIRHSESHGIWVRSNGDIPEFSGNIITENGDVPVNIGSNHADRLDSASSYVGNDEDYIYVRGGNEISEDVTWENLDVDYRLSSSEVEVTDNAVLTIEPGTTLEFEDDGYIELNEQGGLVADGTEEEPIIFTATTEQPGWWNGIYVRSTTNPENKLNWVTVEYGGGEEFFRSGSGNVIIGRRSGDSTIDITNSTIRQSENYGIWVRSNGDIPEFAGNTITENNDSPVNIGSNHAHRLDAASSFSGNEEDHIYVRGNNDIAQDVTWENLNVDYRINSNEVEVTNEAILTIEPGTTIEFRNEGYIELNDQGGLVADGTEDDPIVFTGTTEQPGWWNGIYVRSSTNPENKLNWVTVEYAGGEEFFRSGSGNVIVGRRSGDSSINITDSTLQNSDTHGLWVRSNGTVNDDACDVNTFENNPDGDCVIN